VVRSRGISLVVVVAVCHVACGRMDMCGNEVISRVVSPGGAYQAVIFERDCGATTDFSTQVSVLPADAPFREQPSFWCATSEGNVLVIDGDHGAAPAGPGGGPEVTATWENEHRLVLSYHPRARVFRASPGVGTVVVQYRRSAAIK
jgi:hypothetical protein